MLKYQKKGLCKALSMLLAVVMLLTVPIGTTQAYALEDEQPLVTDNQGELPLGASEVLDSDTTLPEFGEGYPKQYATAHPGSRYVWIAVAPLNGTVTTHYVAVEHNANAPTKEQVKEGKDSNNNVPLVFGYRGSTAAPSGVAIAVGPLPQNETTYDVWVVLEDAEGNLSEPKMVEVRTPIELKMTDGYPKAGAAQAAGSKQVEILAEANGGATAYYVAVTDGTKAPERNQISNKQDGEYKPALASGSVKLNENTEASVMLTLPADATDYDVYVVLYEYNGVGSGVTIWSEVVKLDVKTPLIIANDKVCSIGATQYATLDEALVAVQSGETIKLLKDINYDKGIIIDGKTFTFDVDNFMLNVTNTLIGKTHGVGLEVENAGRVNLVGAGEFNVTTINGAASSDGVLVRENSSAMVTNVKTISGSGNGVYADGDGAIIKVLGNIKAEGSNSCVARTFGTGSITIEGTVAKGLYYVRIHNDLGDIEGVPDSEKPGYLKYSSKIYPGTVWIRNTLPVSDNVCAIGDTGYKTLDLALDYVKTGETIKLLKDINYDKGIKINGKKITFDVGSYILNVVNPLGIGLEVLYGGEVALESTTGQFNVTGAGYGVYVDSGWNKLPTKATVTNAVATTKDDLCDGATANNKGSQIIVLEDAKAIDVKGAGVRAKAGGNITVEGDVEGSLNGAAAEGEVGPSIVEIKGNVTSTANENDGKGIPHGVYVKDYGKVTIGGNVLASGKGSIGAQTYGSGEIKVTGNVEGKKLGIGATGGAIEIGGDAISVDGRNGTGALTESGGKIVINGNAIGGSNGVFARSGNTTIKKDAKGNSGVYAIGDNNIVTVNGSAIATENDGAYAYNKAKIFINGDAISINPSGGYSGYGARADSSSTIEVQGNVKGLGGALADGNSKITIGGNAISTAYATSDVASVYALNNSSVILSGNTLGGQYGAKSLNVGNITIDGRVNQTSYIKLGDTSKSIGDYNKIEAGYHIYSDDDNIVRVKIAEEDTVAPTWPNDSTITGVPTATTLTLTWPEAEDNIGVDKYLIYYVTYTEDTEETKLIGEVTSDNERKFEVIGLTPESDYRIRIKAEDKAGNISSGPLEKTFKTKKAFTVTFDSQGGTLVDNQIITGGNTAADPINPIRAGYTFGGWFKESECLNLWKFDTDTINVNITLYAKWIEGEIKPPTTPAITTNLPITKSVTKGETVTLTVNANVNDGGTLSYQWYKDDNAIGGANADAITITNASSSDSGSYKVIITNTKDGISSITESTICRLTVNSSSGGGNSEHTPTDKDRDKNNKDKQPVEINNGIIILDIDEDNFDENTLVPYVIKNRNEIILKFSTIFDGKMHLIGNSTTDYLLKDNKKYFTDISNHWAKDDIKFVTAREFFDGTGNDEFSPDSLMTRAMAVTALGKLWGADISGFKTSRFIDVESGRNYAPYIEWAAENEIVKGIGNNSFAPDRAITREELAVIIDKFVDFTDLILTEVDKNALAFKDYLLISQWAIDSVEAIQKTEIILGKPGNLFVPKGISTRGEFSAVLKRLIKNIVK